MAITAKVLPGILGLAGGLAFAGWFWYGSTTGFEGDNKFRKRVPGSDRSDVEVMKAEIEKLRQEVAALSKSGPLNGSTQRVDSWPLTLKKGDAKPAKLPGLWPHFRGTNRDSISTEDIKLVRKWGAEGPPKLWSLKVGEGYSGAVVRDGCVYMMDYDATDRRDVMRALSLETGKEIWSSSYGVMIKRSHGMARTVPAVTEKYVVGIGPKCHVTCFDRLTGELKWKIDMVKEYGTKVPTWYTGQNPVIDGDRVILAPAGSCIMMAVELETGKVIWKTSNPKGGKMTHTSILVTTIADTKMYTYTLQYGSRAEVVGVSAEDGRLLWEFTDWKKGMAAVPTPVPVGDGRLFVSNGYGVGSVMIKVEKNGDAFEIKELFRLNAKEFGTEQHTPILFNKHIYGVRQKDNQFVCLDLEGKVSWSSTSSHKFGRGKGPYLASGGVILALDDDGRLSMLEATHTSFKIIAEAKVMDGHEAWAPMALAGGRLIIRDLKNMVCLDLREQ